MNAAGALRRAGAHAHLNAFLELAEPASRDGDEAAGRVSRWPIAVKANIETAGFACSAGTPALADWRPADDAPIVARLRAAGAAVIGTTGMHELAWSITSNNPVHGPVRNPHDPALIAGGSSGGSAAAVAAGVVPAALGTDTAGSVRIPAALCGCVGLRPTTGRYPREGIVPLSHTRDTPGVLAASVAGAATLDAVIAGGTPEPRRDLAGVRLGVPRALFWEGLDPEVERVTERALIALAGAGAELIETAVPALEQLLEPIALPLTLYESVRDLAVYLARRRIPLSLADLVEATAGATERGWMASQLDPATAVSDHEYQWIVRVGRPAVQDAYRACFETAGVDALVAPTTMVAARPIGEDETVRVGDRRVPTLTAYLRNTDPAAVAGLPSVSFPAGRTSAGLPVGLMLDARAGDDRPLLALAEACEAVLADLAHSPTG